jgi:hypothetical protein
MKKMAVSVGLLAVMLCFTTALAQFKTSIEPRSTVAESILKSDDGGLLFGLFDPNNFSMHHSFSLSYQTFGGQGLSMGMYTNSMMYRFSDNLDVNADISLMASPYNTLGKQYQSSLSGLFLNRAEAMEEHIVPDSVPAVAGELYAAFRVSGWKLLFWWN